MAEDAVGRDRLVVPEALHVERGEAQRGREQGERADEHELAAERSLSQPGDATCRKQPGVGCCLGSRGVSWSGGRLMLP